MIEWLKDAIFYEIYPQTFRDSNADGIGDINGIIEKLDYIQDLGCNAIWMNPCFDSPFVDAGYDVRDYYKVAPRYGTNEDLKHLFEEAHERGMHVILDLVPGHTSSECKWFKESCKAERNAYTDRYVWSDSIWNAPTGIGRITGWLRGGYDRDGSAAVNFFTAQPALNYGFYEKDEGQSWQQDIHVIFIEKRTKIVKIYLVPLGVVIMQIAADIVGVKFTGLVCVYLHPLGLHNARVPDILPGLLDGGKLIVGQRLHFPCVVDIPVENVLCLLLTLYRR